jgi:hypothetical protein
MQFFGKLKKINEPEDMKTEVSLTNIKLTARYLLSFNENE